jgi:hypothetical protein
MLLSMSSVSITLRMRVSCSTSVRQKPLLPPKMPNPWKRARPGWFSAYICSNSTATMREIQLSAPLRIVQRPCTTSTPFDSQRHARPNVSGRG